MNNKTLLEKYPEIKRIKEEGNWMVRMDKNGFSFGGFQWNQIGEWTEAPDWNSNEECGGGLHGQGPKGFGSDGVTYPGTRFCFCETDGNHITIDHGSTEYRKFKDIRVQKAKILAIDADAVDLFSYVLNNIPEQLYVEYSFSGNITQMLIQ